MYLTLSRKVICLLANVLGSKTLIGISNPFTHYTNEEMEQEWETTFKKLHALILVDLINEELKFDDTFIEAMWVITKTNVVVETLSDEDEQSLFYFSDNKVIQCLKVTDDEYEIYIQHTPDWTWNHIIIPKMLMGVEQFPVRLNESILIDPQDYKLYCENLIIHNLQDIADLNNIETTTLILKFFSRAIQRKIHNNRLMMFYRQDNQWNIKGLHVLSSPAYNWTLRMVNQNGKKFLEAKQVQGDLLVKDILDIVKSIKVEETA